MATDYSNKEAEIWKPVVGYEGIYEVSNMGRVRRKAGGMGAKAGRILQQSPDVVTGYCHVNLSKNNHRSRRSVHTLVILAFMGAPAHETDECRHLDGNRQNNHLTNLAWGSRQQNAEDSIQHGTWSHGEKHGQAKLNQSQVLEIHGKLRSGVSVSQLSREYGVTRTNIRFIRDGKTWGWLR